MNAQPMRDMFARYDLGGRTVVDSDPGEQTPDRQAAQPVPVDTLTVPQGQPDPYAYPQVIVVQGRTEPSWLREHAGHLIAAAGVGVLGLAVLSVVAIIAVALALAAITSTVAVVAIKAMTTASSPPPRRRRRWSR